MYQMLTFLKLLWSEESIYWKWVYYPKQSIDSMQSLSITNGLFHRTRNIKFHNTHGKTKDAPHSQSSLEKKEWIWRNQPSWFQIMLQSYSYQDSTVLAQKQKYRLMEQNRRPRNKPMHLWVLYFIKAGMTI